MFDKNIRRKLRIPEGAGTDTLHYSRARIVRELETNRSKLTDRQWAMVAASLD